MTSSIAYYECNRCDHGQQESDWCRMCGWGDMWPVPKVTSSSGLISVTWVCECGSKTCEGTHVVGGK